MPHSFPSDRSVPGADVSFPPTPNKFVQLLFETKSMRRQAIVAALPNRLGQPLLSVQAQSLTSLTASRGGARFAPVWQNSRHRTSSARLPESKQPWVPY